MILSLSLKDSLDKPCWSIPFKIESPIIATVFLFTVFLYLWLWSEFFSSFFIANLSALILFCFCFWLYVFTGVMKLWNNWSIFILRRVDCLTMWNIHVSPTISGFCWFRMYSVLIYYLFIWNCCISCIFVQTAISSFFVRECSYYFWFHFILFSEVRNFLQ